MANPDIRSDDIDPAASLYWTASQLLLLWLALWSAPPTMWKCLDIEFCSYLLTCCSSQKALIPLKTKAGDFTSEVFTLFNEVAKKRIKCGIFLNRSLFNGLGLVSGTVPWICRWRIEVDHPVPQLDGRQTDRTVPFPVFWDEFGRHVVTLFLLLFKLFLVWRILLTALRPWRRLSRAIQPTQHRLLYRQGLLYL